MQERREMRSKWLKLESKLRRTKRKLMTRKKIQNWKTLLKVIADARTCTNSHMLHVISVVTMNKCLLSHGESLY